MDISVIAHRYCDDQRVHSLIEILEKSPNSRTVVSGLHGSSQAMILYALRKHFQNLIIVVLPDRESALHMMNDLESLFNDIQQDPQIKKILFFPPSYNNPYDFTAQDHLNVLYRSNVLHRIATGKAPMIIVCTPESLTEPVVQKKDIARSALNLSVGEAVSMDFMIELFWSFGFTQVEYVFEPGQFAVRGGIIDVFSYSFDRPYRIEFSGNQVESIRSFDPYTQDSVAMHKKVMILPNVGQNIEERTSCVFDLLPRDSLFWTIPQKQCVEILENEILKYHETEHAEGIDISELLKVFINPLQFFDKIKKFPGVEFVMNEPSGFSVSVDFKMKPHPNFAKNYHVLFQSLLEYRKNSVRTFIVCENESQMKRLDAIIEDMEAQTEEKVYENLQYIRQPLHSGFVDVLAGIAVLTDHQISERYHRFRFSERHSNAEAITVRDLRNIQPGDYVVHMDYGVGQYAGLEKVEVNGREQEAIRIVYKNNDLLSVSIHSLHKISKFTGKEGTEPQLDKIGSGAWQQKKYKAKSKVKDIARELIKLYAERKSADGFAFQPDSYLQYELEASFMYEDTEDQAKTIQDVRTDMEAEFPMDRLVCGDVGFGKTEVAIRAAFKAAVSGKQTAVLVPTTILALQHFHTFSQRLKDFPVKVEYLNRFRTTAETKKVLDELRSGAIDIIIGTHKLLGKDVEFKDLGLLVIDEEQKFGVSAKEKIRQMKVNVDTLTLTATPIPRTLQFSLMGARDLSVINTPPPNRQPVHTEVISFNAKRIAEIIMYEVNRGGQVFLLTIRF
jgi:transcription-repair coupling factor (superfamily II helicase)